MRSLALIALSFCFMHAARAQDDTADVEAVRRMVSLSEVVVRSDLNISRFLQRIKNDTSFYKAFRNLRPGLKNIIFSCSLCFSSPFLPETFRSIPFTILCSPQIVPCVKNREAYRAAV